MSNSSSRDYFEIETELKKRVEGDIHFDKFSRLLYSTDASIYQIEPIGVVVPRHKGDVQAAIEDRESVSGSGSIPRRRYVACRADSGPCDRRWTSPSTCTTSWR